MLLTNETLIALSLFGLTGFLISGICLLKLKKFKNLAEENQENLELFEKVLKNHQVKLEKSISVMKNQSQNIVRNSQAKKIDVEPKKRIELIENKETSEPENIDLSKQKMEILSLAGRGEDSRTIAEKLGLMTGEVELIVNLNRPLPSYF